MFGSASRPHTRPVSGSPCNAPELERRNHTVTINHTITSYAAAPRTHLACERVVRGVGGRHHLARKPHQQGRVLLGRLDQPRARHVAVADRLHLRGTWAQWFQPQVHIRLMQWFQPEGEMDSKEEWVPKGEREGGARQQRGLACTRVDMSRAAARFESRIWLESKNES